METPVKSAKPGSEPQYGQHNTTVGDELYFSHPEHGVLSGEVVGAGKDGCTIKHEKGEGGHLQQTWDTVLGHRVRKARRIVLVDRGEDGGIGLNEEGKRVFVRGDLPEEQSSIDEEREPSELMQKALDLAPLIKALGDRPASDALAMSVQTLGAAWLAHLKQSDARAEARDIAVEAAEARAQSMMNATVQGFTAALVLLSEQAQEERRQHAEETARMHVALDSILTTLQSVAGRL